MTTKFRTNELKVDYIKLSWHKLTLDHSYKSIYERQLTVFVLYEKPVFCFIYTVVLVYTSFVIHLKKIVYINNKEYTFKIVS